MPTLTCIGPTVTAASSVCSGDGASSTQARSPSATAASAATSIFLMAGFRSGCASGCVCSVLGKVRVSMMLRYSRVFSTSIRSMRRSFCHTRVPATMAAASTTPIDSR